MSSAQMPELPVYSRSIKLSETAKGIRIDVHVYSNTTGEAIEQAFNMYLKAKMTAIDNKIPLAPVDNKDNVMDQLQNGYEEYKKNHPDFAKVVEKEEGKPEGSYGK